MSKQKLFPNRTDLRHQTLKAVAAGEVTILTSLFFKPGATRALDLFRDQGFVDGNVPGGKPYGLTADGETLLSQWDEEVGR